MGTIINISVGLILIFGSLLVKSIVIIQWFNKLGKKIIEKKNGLLVPLLRRFWPRSITPNILTCIRIALVPIIVAMFFDYPKWHVWILILFLIGMLSDFLDGLVAQALDMKSKTGIILDPVADKLLVVPIFFFILQDNSFLLFCLVFAECVLVGTALLVIFLGKDSSSNHFGKWKFTFQAIAILSFLILGMSGWIVGMFWVSMGLAIFSIIRHFKVLFAK